MKKITKLLTLGLSLTLLCGVCGFVNTNSVTNIETRAIGDNFVPTGDTKGGARFSVTHTENEDQAATMLISTTNKDFGAEGFFMRMTNLTGINTPLMLFINGTNNHRVKLKTSAPLFTYDINGENKTELLTREFNSYIMLPANFDGFVYLPFSSFVGDETWGGNAGTEMTWNSVYGLFVALSTKWNSYGNIVFGDMFTSDHSLLDTSSLTSEDFAASFKKDWQSAYVNIDRLTNEKEFNNENKDLKGGFNVKIKETTDNDQLAFFYIHGGNSLVGENIILRVNNHENVQRNIWFYVNGKNGHRVGMDINKPMYSYDIAGENKQTIMSPGYCHLMVVPANFDGFLSIPKTSLVSLSEEEWGNNATAKEMDYNDIYGICIGVNSLYDATMDIDFGDIFTNNDTMFFDGSEYTKEDFGTHLAPDYNGHRVNLVQLEGMKPSTPAFDYAGVNYVGEYDNGAHVTVKKHEEDVLGEVEITPTNKDFTNANAFTLRIKNVSGNFPMQIEIKDNDGKSESLLNQATAANKVKLITKDGVLTNAAPGGNPVASFIPEGFDGTMIIPFNTLTGNGETLSLANIQSITLKIAIYWDTGFSNVIGDVGFVSDDKVHHLNTDVTKLNDASFAETYKVTTFNDFVFIDRFVEAKPSTWMGDVKVLDTLNYGSTDKMKQYITYDPGDNACTYEHDVDGIKVGIGPLESGHAYGNYMALGMFNKGLTTDRLVWNVDQNGENNEALGISVYLKNNSRREIGVNIQFDENGGSTPERWIVKKYPAPYYAYDVVKDAFYSLTAKSDQIQIPVGFEGYVRIPFTSYSVADWCHGSNFPGTDDILDLTKISGNFFLTSDNSRYEGLEFFIKELGIYFNKTVNGSIIQNTNTIKSNMGLDK